VDSAFKHGMTEDDIRWAFETSIKDELMTGYDNKYLLIGFNVKGNLIEVMYNLLDDDTAKVFHAMPARDELVPHWRKGENNG
jgi:hypothetical protein